MEKEQKKRLYPSRAHHHASKKVLLLFSLFLLLSIGSVVATFYAFKKEEEYMKVQKIITVSPSPSPTPEESQVFCTMDAKVCPDGSSVGRVPPTCEFAVCPGN